jgi:hypothetical protein
MGPQDDTDHRPALPGSRGRMLVQRRDIDGVVTVVPVTGLALPACQCTQGATGQRLGGAIEGARPGNW